MTRSLGRLAALTLVLSATGGVAAPVFADDCCVRKDPAIIVGAPKVRLPNTAVAINVPGVPVSAATVVTATGAGVNATAVAGGGFVGAGGINPSTFLGGTGAGYFTPDVGPGAISTSDLNVVGGEPAPVTHKFAQPVRAVCVDDTGVPQPASRLSPETDVAPTYQGEVFRCMAGTALQATVGRFEGETPVFNAGATIMCAKGEALVHVGNGQLRCATQAPERNCNERSLLRKFGPGLKVVHVTRTHRPAAATTGPVTFSGGVGAYDVVY